jgi:hypothetical protein
MEIAVTSVERTDSRKTKDHEHREDEAQQPSCASDSIDCSM